MTLVLIRIFIKGCSILFFVILQKDKKKMPKNFSSLFGKFHMTIPEVKTRTLCSWAVAILFAFLIVGGVKRSVRSISLLCRTHSKFV